MFYYYSKKKKIKGNKHKNKSIHLVPNSRRATKKFFFLIDKEKKSNINTPKQGALPMYTDGIQRKSNPRQ